MYNRDMKTAKATYSEIETQALSAMISEAVATKNVALYEAIAHADDSEESNARVQALLDGFFR